MIPSYSSAASGRPRNWTRVPWLRAGLLTGIGLSLVLVAWLFIANRIPALEEFALIRNAVAAALIMILMILPAVTYARSPGRLLASGLIAWSLFALCYRLMEMIFELLETRVGAFQLFILGAVVYLIAAVLSWVTAAWLSTRRFASRVHHGKIH